MFLILFIRKSYNCRVLTLYQYSRNLDVYSWIKRKVTPALKSNCLPQYFPLFYYLTNHRYNNISLANRSNPMYKNTPLYSLLFCSVIVQLIDKTNFLALSLKIKPLEALYPLPPIHHLNWSNRNWQSLQQKQLWRGGGVYKAAIPAIALSS